MTALALTLAALGGTAATASPASATEALGARAVREAQSHSGQPYVYGAAGPNRFDCSGFTLYVFSKLGKRLPHNSTQQYNSPAVRHIANSERAVGDLVFMKNRSSRITHVGIYAGGNRWWVAPKSGDRVRLQALYSSNYVVARLR